MCWQKGEDPFKKIENGDGLIAWEIYTPLAIQAANEVAEWLDERKHLAAGMAIRSNVLEKKCSCVIEMATFRTKGDPCPHCGLEITDTLLL